MAVVDGVPSVVVVEARLVVVLASVSPVVTVFSVSAGDSSTAIAIANQTAPIDQSN